MANRDYVWFSHTNTLGYTYFNDDQWIGHTASSFAVACGDPADETMRGDRIERVIIDAVATLVTAVDQIQPPPVPQTATIAWGLLMYEIGGEQPGDFTTWYELDSTVYGGYTDVYGHTAPIGTGVLASTGAAPYTTGQGTGEPVIVAQQYYQHADITPRHLVPWGDTESVPAIACLWLPVQMSPITSFSFSYLSMDLRLRMLISR